MIDTLVNILRELRAVVSAHKTTADEGSLAARKALILAANYVGDLVAGMAHNRDAQKFIAIACSEAGSKLRRVSPELAAEFLDFGLFWSSGVVAQNVTSFDQLDQHVKILDKLLREKNLKIM